MSDTVIRIENLGKKYMLAHKQPQKYIALRDVLVDRAKQLGQKIMHPFAGQENASASGQEEFWALKDVSLDIKQGERVGIIGRNGAGKSTLLKILSRITEPTTGRVSIKGRIASLLEVGTGFHPELTGRENIYLNGAILGMSRAEIKKNFDAIVDFAEVEKFLDTPVKRYSSGMYVRLAFAVAAHLDTEILLVDEVLAVGDAEFQKKCMGKMDEVSHKQGRTILFVSHNMGAVKQLCSRALLLQDGQYICYGEVAPTLDRYAVQAKNSHSVFERHDRKGNGVLKIANLEFMDKAFFLRTVFFPAEELNIKISLLSEEKIVSKDINYRIDIGVDDLWGTRIAWLSSSLFCNSLRFSEDNKNVFFSIPKLNLAPGKYDLTVCVHVENEVADWMSHVGSFSVEQGKYYPHGMISQLASGYFFLDYDVNSSLREDIKCIP